MNAPTIKVPADEQPPPSFSPPYTTQHPEPGEARPHRSTVAALTGVLANEGITIREGIYLNDTAYSPYDALPGENIAIPLSITEYSRVNAEFIYRSSSIAPTNQNTLPTATNKHQHAAAVEHHMEAITDRSPAAAIQDAHRLWTGMLATKDQDVLKLIAYFQFPHIRDQLMAAIPGIDEPPEHILFAQTDSTPNWSRIGWAQQLALDTDPGNRFARLTGHMLGAGIKADLNPNKNTAYRNQTDLP
jgi:hypothetical protein